MSKFTTGILILLCTLPLSLTFSQSPSSTHGIERLNSLSNFDLSHSTIDDLAYENIGPTIFSGRVSDVAVDPEDPTHFYVGYSSGGLWETKNNGTTFTPIFDHEDVMTIGDIAVNWRTNEIWVGTGEVNSSRSSYAGLGIYKSSDNGETWSHLGLEESHHIGRIILDKEDPARAWVAVLGHLYSDNPERGIYMTKDGGVTWTQTLFVNDKTGAVDLVQDHLLPNVLYASTWERRRYAWDFVEAGPGSGIYKSIDYGVTWNKVSIPNSGFPDGEGTGRIGLSISSDGSTSTLYALLDNYNRRAAEEKEDDEDESLVKDNFKTMSKDAFLKLDKKKLTSYLKDNRFPEKYSVDKVISMVKEDQIEPSDLATYLENANALLFDTPVIGAELYRSTDGGKSWQKTHENFLDGLYYSYGYYFGVVSAHPSNPDQVYIAGVPILRSDDGGATFKNVNGANVHSDHHSIWINPENPRHIVNGNDGGINISYDSGDNWIKCNSPSVGQFYYINADHAKTYNVYGGLQDNGVWKGSHRYNSGVRWHSSGQYPYKSILGGDGMQVQIDPRDNNTVYTGFQFGNYFRIDVNSGKRTFITPRHDLGDSPHRWNWQSPIHLSIHQPDILYMGGEKVFRSLDQGDNFEAISEDLTQGGKKGDVPYGTLTSIHESPLQFGLLYAGSDDGLVHVSKDGGYSWENVSSTLPPNLWVSRVQASAHKLSRVYLSLNGYRSDHFDAYTYMSDDYGATWKRIGTELPNEPVNVIKEDPKNEHIIYVGTDKSVYISLNMGQSFMQTSAKIPNVPVHDIVVQEEAQDLLIGTHGRSIYRADIEPLYQLVDSKDPALLVMDIKSLKHNKNLGSRRNSFSKYVERPQVITIFSDVTRAAEIEITKEGLEGTIWKKNVDLNKGLNYISYDLSIDNSMEQKYSDSFDPEVKTKTAKNGKMYLLPGSYLVSVNNGTLQSSAKLEIKK